MADARTLHDAFIDELRDTYDAERQLTKALAKLAKTATAPQLREAFEAHLEERRARSNGSNRYSSFLMKKSAANTAMASRESSKRVSPSWKRTSTRRRWMHA